MIKKTPLLTIFFLLFISSFFILFPKSTHAYLDPGAGSYILQLLAAALLGGLFTIKVFWVKVKKILVNLFSGTKRDNRKDNHD